MTSGPTTTTTMTPTPSASAPPPSASASASASAVATAGGASSTALIPNSMWQSPAEITAGALVILFESHNAITYCYATHGEVFYNRHGAFRHDDMIGARFGTKLVSSDKTRRGYMYLLAPTPELWSRALRHRTQIVYSLDASAIQFHAALRAGHRVVESGTGSGALTTSLARAVAPAGHVFTFEFNPTRAQVAKEEFARNGLTGAVTVECRDACEDGFPEALADSIDLVFLDLPCPWKAVPHATRVLKAGGRLASYSPCIEQVQKTCDALREAGYELIKTIETRLVPYSTRAVEMPVPDFGFTGVEAEQKGTKTKEEKEEEEETADGPSASKKRRVNGKSVGGQVLARKDTEIRGHTAFLTFACKFFV